MVALFSYTYNSGVRAPTRGLWAGSSSAGGGQAALGDSRAMVGGCRSTTVTRYFRANTDGCVLVAAFGQRMAHVKPHQTRQHTPSGARGGWRGRRGVGPRAHWAQGRRGGCLSAHHHGHRNRRLRNRRHRHRCQPLTLCNAGTFAARPNLNLVAKVAAAQPSDRARSLSTHASTTASLPRSSEAQGFLCRRNLAVDVVVQLLLKHAAQVDGEERASDLVRLHRDAAVRPCFLCHVASWIGSLQLSTADNITGSSRRFFSMSFACLNMNIACSFQCSASAAERAAARPV